MARRPSPPRFRRMVTRVVAWFSMSVVLTACAAAEPSPRPHRASAAATSVQFVKPPVAIFNPRANRLVVWVRLDRPLRHNVGHSAEHAGHAAFIEVAGAWDDDIVGLEHDVFRPTCYGEYLSVRRDRGPF